MWDHAQAFKLDNYHYTVQLTLDPEHVTHDTLTAGRLSVVLSLSIFLQFYFFVSVLHIL